MKKIILIVLISTGLHGLATAQDFESGITIEEMDMSKYDKDSRAHAVVLNEFGKTRIDDIADDRLKLIYQYHVKIKIFDNQGFDNGTIEIPIHNSDDTGEEVDDIKGTTYYKDDNGITQKVDLDAKKVFTVRDYKYGSTVKFALPGLRAGCVIEYSYRLTSPYWDSFRKWDFQTDIPKVISQYDVHIPGFWNFNVSLRGTIKLASSKAEIERECFTSHGAKADCSHIVYVMKDIPAFIEEDFMTAPKNFKSAISFELIDYTSPYTGLKTVVTKEWKDIDYQLKVADEFGSQLKKTSLLKERIIPVIANKTDELEKAQAIYAYVQKWFKWNNYIGIYSSGIRKALDEHTGSIADINLTLVTALNAAGINTEAVVLSTREHGEVNTLYPVVNDFNYVVAKANIGEKSYLLDATDPLLSFGLLPLKCLNDKGRVISLNKPSYWIDLNQKQKATTTRAFDLTLMDNGKIKGTMTSFYAGYDAYEHRKEIKKYNSADEYVENVDEKLPKVKILNSEFTNLDSLNKPLGEKFDIEIDAFDNLDHTRLTFNPFIWERKTNNPFKLTDRDYPVDWGMTSDDRLVLTMHLPAQYTVETPPQVVGYSMANKGGMFVTSFEMPDNIFTFSNITQFNKSIYDPSEYASLKEFYNKIILTEKADMVFKKK